MKRVKFIRRLVRNSRTLVQKALKTHVAPEGRIHLSEFTVLLFQDNAEASQKFLDGFFSRFSHDTEEVKDSEVGLPVPETELEQYMNSFPSDRLKQLDQVLIKRTMFLISVDI